eukprot:m.77422 g.77422  ORF g.77422 m.77422 type:complete len:719 (+) comp12621_c0_seq5:219-2375(+)
MMNTRTFNSLPGNDDVRFNFAAFDDHGGMNMQRPFISPISPIQGPANDRTALSNLANTNVGRRTMFKGNFATTYVPNVAPSGSIGASPINPHDESLISLGDVCGDLQNTPRKNGQHNMSSISEQNESRYDGFNESKYGFDDSRLSIGNKNNLSTLSQYGFSVHQPDVEQARVKATQARIASVNKVNEQVRGVSSAAIPVDSVDLTRAKKGQEYIRGVRLENPNVRNTGAGHLDKYSNDITRSRHAQDLAWNAKAVNEQVRGSSVGYQTQYGLTSTQMSKEISNQSRVAYEQRVNQQIMRGVKPATLPASNVETNRVRSAQTHVANTRMVNNQFRGADVGAPNLYNTDSRQLSNETYAQTVIAGVRRVNEQSRGELAGQRTLVDTNAKYIAHEMGTQKDISKYRSVNEQIAGVGRPSIPLQSVDNQRTKYVQGYVGDYKRVNEQIRGDGAQRPTRYGLDSKTYKAFNNAQTDITAYRRVNEQARGGYGAMKNNVNYDSKYILDRTNAPKVALVNTQVREVGRGRITTDAYEFSHVKSQQALRTRLDHAKKANIGMSKFGHGSVEHSRIASVPRPSLRNDQVRGALAGQRTNFDASSQGIRSALSAPKVSLVNPQIRTGGVSRDKPADSSAFSKVAEWIPPSEMIPVEEEVEPVKQETPKKATPPPTPREVKADDDIREQFGLRRLSKRAAEQPSSATNGNVPAPSPKQLTFAEALKQFR